MEIPAVQGSNFSFWVIAIIVILLVYIVIWFVKKHRESSTEHTELYYKKWKYAVVIIFCAFLCATGYLLFSPAGGLYTGTMSLWDYWTNDILNLLSSAASNEVIDGLTTRKILIWPCFITDAICIYAYIMLDKKA